METIQVVLPMFDKSGLLERGHGVLKGRIEREILGLGRIKKLEQVVRQVADAENTGKATSLVWTPKANGKRDYESIRPSRHVLAAVYILKVRKLSGCHLIVVAWKIVIFVAKESLGLGFYAPVDCLVDGAEGIVEEVATDAVAQEQARRIDIRQRIVGDIRIAVPGLGTGETRRSKPGRIG